MIPKASMSYQDDPGAKRLKMHLDVFDPQQLGRLGNVGETFACDIRVNVAGRRIGNTLTWSGAMRNHQIGKNNSRTTSEVSFNSDMFKSDNIGKELTPSAVEAKTAEIKEVMDSMSNRLLRFSGASESHPDIPNMIRDVSPYLGFDRDKELTPSEITSLTKPKALALARRVVIKKMLTSCDQELRAHLTKDTPQKYRGHATSKKLHKRVAIFGNACGTTMTSSMKMAKNIHCIEQAHYELRSRAEVERSGEILC